ncbi:MAG TPA: pitrilysin family protein [Myxococcaceae bacterium]|nr:pitrilysin family protein [Myxococcaceae bacterium]
MSRPSMHTARLAAPLFAVLAACATSSEQAPTTPPKPAAQAPAAPAPKPTAPGGTPDADFRAQAPPAGPPVTFRPPVPKVLTLKSGLAVWLLERHELPLVSLELLVDAGSNTNPPGVPGVSSFVADMLDEGTATRDAPAIAAAFDDLAAIFHAASDQETFTASLSVPTESLAAGVEVFADVVLHPAFRPGDVERVRRLRQGELVQMLDDPEKVGRDVLGRVVYGERHPWAYSPKGTVDSNPKIGRAALAAWYRTWVRPNNATLVVVGDVREAELVSLLEKSFAGWAKGKVPKKTMPPPAPPPTRTLVLVDKADAAQSQVWIGDLGLTSSSPELYAARAANNVLGGGPKGRLFAVLRTQKAYSYGAYSELGERLSEPGLFAATGGIVADKTPEAVEEFFGVLDGLAKGGMSDGDLADAKSAVIRGLPSRFQTNAATATAFATARGLGFSPDYFAELPARVEAVTRTQADQAARAHFTTAKAAVVVVGPMKSLQKRLEDLHVGPVQVRDPSGKLLSKPSAPSSR